MTGRTFVGGAAIVAAIVLVAALGGIGPFARGSPAATGPLADDARDGAFALRIGLARTTYHLGEAIDVQTTATYVGSAATVRAWSAWDSLVVFTLEQIDGPRDMLDSVSDLMCLHTDLVRNQPVHVPFEKNGSYTATDPEAAFWKQYFADHDLRLPVGRWRIVARLEAALDPDCQGRESTLSAAVTFNVVP